MISLLSEEAAGIFEPNFNPHLILAYMVLFCLMQPAKIPMDKPVLISRLLTQESCKGRSSKSSSASVYSHTCSLCMACFVKGHLPNSASTAFQVAKPITWPLGDMAGFCTGIIVIGSITPGSRAFSSASLSAMPFRF